MTNYTIEARASAERYDLLARQVAREVLQLPFLDKRQEAYKVQTGILYHLSGNLNPSDVDQLTRQLLIDPVTQQASFSSSTATTPTLNPTSPDSDYPHAFHIVEVHFHPGVTDTLAESILAGASMLGIRGLQHAETGHRYYLDARLSEHEIRQITEALLYNPVIQNYSLHPATINGTLPPSEPSPASPTAHEPLPPSEPPPAPCHSERSEESVSGGRSDASEGRILRFAQNDMMGARNDMMGARNDMGQGVPIADLGRERLLSPTGAAMSTTPAAQTIPLSGMTDDQLLDVSKRGLLALNLDEMRTIQRHFREQGREPSDVELETLAQTWSEHCSHKTFKATINYREIDGSGALVEEETIAGLLKSYIMRATQQVARPWVVSAFSDNAGIVRFTETHDIAFKVETHNHPSAIEPFGGANTGVGGVIRDVLGVSAEPIACTDILCFGPPETPASELPAGVLTPHRIAGGVVNGVRDYGNKMGIPTVNGAILYHPGYIYNPLVFCGCLGILPRGSHPHAAQPGDVIVVLGGRTGRDGIHGATFSSGEMSRESNAQAGSAVQIGAPITEKKVTDVILQARDRQLYSAITDCGAGGFSSAIGEMAAESGATVELEKAPLKYQGLAPWEIWLSEAQERMVLAVPPRHINALLDICAVEEVEASILGSFTDTQRLVVTYVGQIVADLDMHFLHDGRPPRHLEAVWTQNVGATLAVARPGPPPTTALLSLLRHPSIASKEAVVRRYDHEVQGATVLKPLVGRAGNGPGDAAVLQPILDEASDAAIVLANGINPLYGTIDPYHMALNAVDEALRNLAAVGGDIERAALLDNFCWGNPTDPAQLGSLVRAVKGCYDAAVGFGTPFISGKDSLNNEYRANGERLPVIPTLLVSAVCTLDNAAQTVDMSLKAPGNLLYLVGLTHNELGGSHYLEIGKIAGNQTVPHVDIPSARVNMQAVGSVIRAGLAQACHDLSEGGLAVAAAEMSLAGLLGLTIDLATIPTEPTELSGMQLAQTNAILLFSESASRFLLEVAPAQQAAFEEHMRARGVTTIAQIGQVTQTARFIMRHGAQTIIDLPIDDLQTAWKGDLA